MIVTGLLLATQITGAQANTITLCGDCEYICVCVGREGREGEKEGGREGREGERGGREGGREEREGERRGREGGRERGEGGRDEREGGREEREEASHEVNEVREVLLNLLWRKPPH